MKAIPLVGQPILIISGIALVWVAWYVSGLLLQPGWTGSHWNAGTPFIAACVLGFLLVLSAPWFSVQPVPKRIFGSILCLVIYILGFAMAVALAMATFGLPVS